jgi:DNA-binding SARP family transcriptional activator
MTVRLSLLDAFELTCDGEPVPLQQSGQRLLSFLALHPRPLQRTYVAGSLWPDIPEDRAQRSLRSALWRVRRVDRPLAGGEGGRLGLHPSVEVDVRELVELAHAVLDDSRDVPATAATELIALSGDLLPDCYEDWIAVEREHVRQLRLHALEVLCDALVETGRCAAASEAALAVVAADPLRESAHRALIRVHLAEGNLGEALRQYAFFRRLSEQQLGLVPSSEMELLIAPVTGSVTDG